MTNQRRKCSTRIHFWRGRGRWGLFGVPHICSTSSESLTTSAQTSPPLSVRARILSFILDLFVFSINLFFNRGIENQETGGGIVLE